MKAPRFWWRDPGLRSTMLAPAGTVYARLAAMRTEAPPDYVSPLPVICIGNVTIGGSGKTPTVLAMVKRLHEMGHRPHVLSRGFGGMKSSRPVKVDPRHHTAQTVGDEPLLLATAAPTWVGADRVASAKAAEAENATVLLMDDGFQNPALGKSVSLLVFDGLRGIGNGRAIPAGPLREDFDRALARASASVIIGEDTTQIGSRLAARLPVLYADLVSEPQILPKRVFGFCGIGNPEKFRRTLAGLDTELIGFEAFGDHHRYGAHEVQRLAEMAAALDAVLVTTEKDAARLGSALPKSAIIIRVALQWRDAYALDALLTQAGIAHG